MSSSSLQSTSSVLPTNQSSSETGISVSENVPLHYDMLSFIYEKQSLSKSKLCFMWSQFKKTCDVDNTAEELKYIFNCTILPNITDYEQLDEDQKRYFKLVEVLDKDETEKILMNNEPQAGLDYKFIRENDDDSSDSELDDTNLEMLIKENLKNSKNYHGQFENDLAGENDGYVLKIKAPTPDNEYVETDGEMEYELAVIISALLTTDEERANDVRLLSQEQIISRLQTNRDLFARSSQFCIDSSDVTVHQEPDQSVVKDIPANSYSSTDSEPLTPQDISANCSSLSYPEPLTTQGFLTSTPYVAQPSTSMATEPSTSMATEPSTSMATEPSTSMAIEPSTILYAVPRIKTKAALVPNPKYNPRMAMFVERFTSKKRPRRSSSSPPNSN